MRYLLVLVSIATALLASTALAKSPNPDTSMIYFVHADPNDNTTPLILTVTLELKTEIVGNGYTDYTIERVTYTEWIDGTTVGRVWQRDWPNLAPGNVYFRHYDNQTDAPPISDIAVSSAPLVDNLIMDTAGVDYEDSSEQAMLIDLNWLAVEPVEVEPVVPDEPLDG